MRRCTARQRPRVPTVGPSARRPRRRPRACQGGPIPASVAARRARCGLVSTPDPLGTRPTSTANAWPPTRPVGPAPSGTARSTVLDRLLGGQAPAWHRDAACRGQDTSVFFRDDRKGQARTAAATWCAGCPVREPCLQVAQAIPEQFGVFGGLTARERDQLRRQARQARQAGRPRQAARTERAERDRAEAEAERRREETEVELAAARADAERRRAEAEGRWELALADAARLAGEVASLESERERQAIAVARDRARRRARYWAMRARLAVDEAAAEEYRLRVRRDCRAYAARQRARLAAEREAS